MNDNFAIATMVGNYFKQHPTMTMENWITEKEYATIAEKAINFSKKSGKPLEETITTKWDELKKGLIMAKNHDFDEYTRGFIAGWFLEKDISDVTTRNIFEEVEKFWETKWFNLETNKEKEEMYCNAIIAKKKYREYKDKGMITLQELTRKCLALMEQGLGDKMVAIFPDKEYILSGNVKVESEEIRNSLFMSSANMRNVNADDIVVMT